MLPPVSGSSAETRSGVQSSSVDRVVSPLATRETIAMSSHSGAITYTSEKTDAAKKPAARSALELTGNERVGLSRALSSEELIAP